MQNDLDSIKKTGVNVVGLSYDKAEKLAQFGEKENIQFPLLSDPESKVIRKLGILNAKPKKGSKQAGIAHPMTILIGTDQKVAGVIPGTVRQRHNSDQLISTANKMQKGSDETKVNALSFKMKDIKGKDVDLSKYDGKVVVMVNVASKCGMTPQYAPLQDLYDEYKDKGLVVLGFPCNQFGSQEPGSESEIMSFCEENYGVEFDMFSKVDVNGDDAAPLFKYLTSQDTKPKGAGRVRWNFEKFVVGRDGQLVGRFGSRISPDSEDFLTFLKEQLENR